MDDNRQELLRVVDEWDRAMITNDAEAIGAFMADEWTIVGPDGSIGNKADFLAFIVSEALTHDVMTSEDVQLRIYGDTALVIARGVSGGAYQGQAFREVERSSNVFVKDAGRWRCVHAHLSKLAPGTRDLRHLKFPMLALVASGWRAAGWSYVA